MQAVEEIKELTKPQGARFPLKGAEGVLEACVAEGADTIFGYPGGAIMPIYDALYDYQEKINHILVRHEQGAIHAAQGYARASGRTGVVFATSGPGATNLVTGLADAMIDSTPLVCITFIIENLQLRIFSNVDQYRSGPSTSRDIKCLGEYRWDFCCISYLVIPFCNRRSDINYICFLESIRA